MRGLLWDWINIVRFIEVSRTPAYMSTVYRHDKCWSEEKWLKWLIALTKQCSTHYRTICVPCSLWTEYYTLNQLYNHQVYSLFELSDTSKALKSSPVVCNRVRMTLQVHTQSIFSAMAHNIRHFLFTSQLRLHVQIKTPLGHMNVLMW